MRQCQTPRLFRVKFELYAFADYHCCVVQADFLTAAVEEGSDADLMLKEQMACPTVFDAAQTNIFNLMNRLVSAIQVTRIACGLQAPMS
jgi:hypothetical protein